MYKRLLAAMIVFCFGNTLWASPSGQVITDGSKLLSNPFVTLYTRVKNYIQSDATKEKVRKAVEIVQKVAIATVVANLILPNDMKYRISKMPIINRCIFYGYFMRNYQITK